MANRKSLSVRTRFEVFKRDKFTCCYCGRTPPTVILEVDHVLAVVNGGGDESTNLVTSCFDCNRGKGSELLDCVPRPLVDQLAEEADAAQQLEEYNRYLLEDRRLKIEWAENAGMYWMDHMLPEDERGRFTFNLDRTKSVVIFLKSLPFAELLEAMDIAIGRVPYGPPKLLDCGLHSLDDAKTWKYFCGVCWKKIRDREQGGK